MKETYPLGNRTANGSKIFLRVRQSCIAAANVFNAYVYGETMRSFCYKCNKLLKDPRYKQMYVDIVKKKDNLLETRNSDWNTFKKAQGISANEIISWKTREKTRKKTMDDR